MKDTVVDFTGLAASIFSGPSIGSGGLIIAGGKLLPSGGKTLQQELEAFLLAWDFPGRAMPYAIWEHMSRIVFKASELPDNYDEFVRGRVFGPGGDMNLRRSGEQVFWSFIGPQDALLIDGYTPDLYWTTHEGERFYCLKRRYLLWGDRGPGEDQWVEPRVGEAELRYPKAYLGNGVVRAYVNAQEYTSSGRVEFTWFIGLELEEEEASNGSR